jgi:hypothetical protein
MTQLALFLTAAAEHETAPLIAPPIVIALVMAIFFTVIALITYSYRDVANRHAGKSRGASQSQDNAH